MNRCTAMTLKGTQCTRTANEGGCCSQHTPIEVQDKCVQCKKRATQEGRCTLHYKRYKLFLAKERYRMFVRNPLFEKAKAKIEEGRDWKDVIHTLWLHLHAPVCVFPTRQEYLDIRRDISIECDIRPILADPLYVDRQHLVQDWKSLPIRITFMDVIDLLGLEGAMRFSNDAIRVPEDILQARVNDLFYDRMSAPPQTTYRTELEKLAHDTQNVHTREVNSQTAKMLTKVLELDDGRDCCEEVWKAFRENGLSVLKVQKDVNKWYSIETCRTAKDWLYRRCLNGVWKLICQHKAKDELVKRLYEECLESVKLCCDGHIARLCNTMVGFDDDFVPSVSLGEMLQSKMSAIAMREEERDVKVKEAEEVMKELGVPAEERVAWLEAF